jgi:uncharacterized protein (TIGR00369 family)
MDTMHLSTPAPETDNRTDYFGAHIPLMDYLGLVPEHIEPGLARTRLPWRVQLTNSRGDVHGGTLMRGLVSTLSAAARADMDAGISMATIDMTTSFFAPANGELVVEARCLKRGRSIAFCEGEIRNAQGEVVCKASGTFRIVRPKP